MIELKTLKDIELPILNSSVREVLKQEAIKWIKSLEEKIKVPNKKVRAGRITLWNLEIQNWIIHFFNLTKEDLK